jgi:hypothetical protein
MDIVIPLSEDSGNDFLDLRYALRGFELFLPHGKIVLIGAKPAWIKNVTYIPAKDHPDSSMRERNIFEKLCLYQGDEFIYCGDDYYLLESWREEYHWDMSLRQKFNAWPLTSNYKKTLGNTLMLAPLEKNYDTHCPITMRRDILHSLKKIRWFSPFGFCLQSLYCQAAKISGTQYPDLKLRQPFTFKDIKGRKWFSTADGVVEKSLRVMDKLYPKKSKYEA